MRLKPFIIDLTAAALCVLLAWVMRWALAPMFGTNVPFITFFPFMFLLAYLRGFRATLMGVALSTLVLVYAILEPVHSIDVAVPEYRLGLGIYVAVSLAGGWLGQRIIAARRDARQATEDLIREGKQLRRNVADRKKAEEALTFLAHASATLAALTDRESALQQAARLPLPFLADWCVVYVVDDEGGAIDYYAHAHIEPEQEKLLAEMLSRFPLDWDSNTATVRALRTGESQLMEELPEPLLTSLTQSDEHRAMVAILSPHAVISVPLKIRDRIIGVIGLVACDPKRRYTPREVAIAESMAERIAVAVENARLFHAVSEANRQKDEFLAMLAHELRNPLAAIRYAVALGQLSPEDSAAEMFGIIDRQTGNLARLIDDLLDVSRISRNKVTLRQESISAKVIVESAVATVRPLIEEKNHALKLDLGDPSPQFFVDPTRAEQIVANLLTNAAKYTNKGGMVTVRVRPENGDGVIQVIDTGIGLKPEMLDRVFDLFAQADRTLDRSQGGLGIGLTVAKKLSEMHGGSIAVHSDGPGTGSTFTVRLPLAEPTAIQVEPLSADATAEPVGPRRILIVDDNRDTAMSCTRLFRTLGHKVETAYEGAAALELARTFRPEAIFLDIGLPGMSGFDICKQLRADGFTQEVIVAVSGYGQPEDRQRSHEAGFDDHLIKPVPHDALISALGRIGKKHVVVS